MLLSFSIGTFLTNHDVTCKKLQMYLIHSSVQKRGQNKSMETSHNKWFVFLVCCSHGNYQIKICVTFYVCTYLCHSLCFLIPYSSIFHPSKFDKWKSTLYRRLTNSSIKLCFLRKLVHFECTRENRVYLVP